MHLFTIIQALGLGILWAIKETKSIALAFPFFVVSMLGLRWSMKFIFDEKELDYVSIIEKLYATSLRSVASLICKVN